jgi:hypothetical protein
MSYRLAKTLLAAAFLAACLALMPMSAVAATKSGGATAPSSSNAGSASGGVSPSDPQFQPTGKARIVNGLAVPPAGAPQEVVGMINAANQIAKMPYKWGGGHKDFEDTGYDCSGTVSYVLNGANAGLLTTPLDSSSFMRWGKPGKGKWATVYTNPGHAFIMVAGLRFDTGYRDNTVRGTHPGRGPRWGKKRSTSGFTARHPDGL